MRTVTHSLIAEAKRLGFKNIRLEYTARSARLLAELNGATVVVPLPRRALQSQRDADQAIAHLHRRLHSQLLRVSPNLRADLRRGVRQSEGSARPEGRHA